MHLRALLCLLSLPLLTGCWTAGWESEPCPDIAVKVADTRLEFTEHYSGPVYDDYLERDVLECAGHPYQARDSIFVDDSCFSPRCDESFSDYVDRVMETMQICEEESTKLREAIASTQRSNEHLAQQLAGLRDAHQELLASISGNGSTSPASQSNNSFERYLVQKGDTLQKISHYAYNTHRGWLNIYRFNLHRLPHGPNEIEVGQWLLIPQLKDDSNLSRS